jgi:hypothetical protein
MMALSLGFSYRQAQSMTGHKDIRMIVRYDHERGNLEVDLATAPGAVCHDACKSPTFFCQS